MRIICKGLDLDKSMYTFPFEVETKKKVFDGDWKTAIVHRIPPIPEGTKLEVTDMFQNFEGIWLEAKYEGWLYSIDPHDVDVV